MLDKQYWIDQLGLLPHPEGGYYKELPDKGVVSNHSTIICRIRIRMMKQYFSTCSHHAYFWVLALRK